MAPTPEPGVGAVNVNRDVVLFVRGLVGNPDGYVCRPGGVIAIREGARTIHSGVYGARVHSAASRKGQMLAASLGLDGVVVAAYRLIDRMRP